METVVREEPGAESSRHHHAADYHYAWMARLNRISWAWEFLRRNPHYQSEWKQNGAKPHIWGLQHFEDPCLDARDATVFWRPEACPAVLPVTATALEEGIHGLQLSKLKCLTTVVPGTDNRSADVLFHRECRFLQIAVTGAPTVTGVQLSAPVIPMPKQAAGRAMALRRFTNLVTSCALQPNLYPADRRSPRLIKVLEALDGWRAEQSYRDIAVTLHGERRVNADWNDPRDHLRDQVRRAVYYGRRLMSGGYRQFLR